MIERNMGLAIVFLMLLSMCACANPYPIVKKYSWGKIVRDTQYNTDDFCLTGEKFWDDGSYIKPGEHVNGCLERKSGDIHVVDNCEGAKAIPHELCHLDGKHECEDYDW